VSVRPECKVIFKAISDGLKNHLRHHEKTESRMWTLVILVTAPIMVLVAVSVAAIAWKWWINA